MKIIFFILAILLIGNVDAKPDYINPGLEGKYYSGFVPDSIQRQNPLKVLIERFKIKKHEVICVDEKNCSYGFIILPEDESKPRILYINGGFEDKMVDTIYRYGGMYTIDVLAMTSRGGWINSFIEVASFVSDYKIAFLPVKYCFSACAFMVSFGDIMFLPEKDTIIGFHRIYSTSGKDKVNTVVTGNELDVVMREALGEYMFEKYSKTDVSLYYYPSKKEVMDMYTK